MKLISRKKSPPKHHRALGFLRLAVRALVAARMARRTVRTYRHARRLPMLLIGGGILALVLKKLRGGGGAEQPAQTWTPAPPAPTPTPASAATNGAADGPELSPEGGDIAPELEQSDKPPSPS